jgi:glucose/arabinose dehydrogenase/endonuclease I
MSGALAFDLQLTRVAELDGIVDIRNARDGSDRLFLIEQAGRVLVLLNGEVQASPFLDIRDRVRAGGERGLLSIAFAPDFRDSGHFYLWYTNADGDTVLSRFRAGNPQGPADPGSEQILLTVEQPFSNHNGGRLMFGPDGMLYLGLGDGGSGNDPLNAGQSGDTLLGKIIRIDVDPALGGYGIPKDNPFVGDAGILDEIWALGVRNPWRLSFDGLTGDLYIADVGQGAREEVNFQPASSAGGENYGWKIMEGSRCTDQSGCEQTGLTLPVAEYSHDIGCSITGGEVYRGSDHPSLYGRYLFADYCSGRIWGLLRGNGGWQMTALADTDFRIVTFGEDESGNVYISARGDGIYLLSDGIPPPPEGYYDTAVTSSPAALRASLHEIIDDHTSFPYASAATDTWDVLEIADEDQDNPGNVITIYRNASYMKMGGGNNDYNREHTWPVSYGFPGNDPGNIPFTDMHHLFIADQDYNSDRSNHPFNNCDASCEEKPTTGNNGRGGENGPQGGPYPGDSNWRTGFFTQGRWEVWNGRKGDIARAMFYMDLRYEGGMHTPTGSMEPDLILTDNLALIDQSNTGEVEAVAYMGMLSVLLEWHRQDPVDLIEFQHHEAVAAFQGNRNPFIDHPEWVACIFGTTEDCVAEDPWENPLRAGRGRAAQAIADAVADLTPPQTNKAANRASLDPTRGMRPRFTAPLSDIGAWFPRGKARRQNTEGHEDPVAAHRALVQAPTTQVEERESRVMGVEAAICPGTGS